MHCTVDVIAHQWDDKGDDRGKVMTTHRSGRRFGVRSVYTLAGEWGTGSHPLALPSIYVSRQSTGLGKTMRLKASKSVFISQSES